MNAWSQLLLLAVIPLHLIALAQSFRLRGLRVVVTVPTPWNRLRRPGAGISAFIDDLLNPQQSNRPWPPAPMAQDTSTDPAPEPRAQSVPAPSPRGEARLQQDLQRFRSLWRRNGTPRFGGRTGA